MLKMASNVEYLRKVRLFSAMKENEIQKIAGLCKRISYEKGQILFLQEAPAQHMFIIVSGRVRIERTDKSAETTVLATRYAGEVIGEMSLLDGQPRSAQAVAETDTKVLALSAHDFKSQVLKDPTMCLGILQTLSHRLREAATHAQLSRSTKVHEHLLTHLATLADSEGFIKIEVTQATLADTIGCSRGAINRAFQRLVRDGSIIRRKRDLIELVRKD